MRERWVNSKRRALIATSVRKQIDEIANARRAVQSGMKAMLAVFAAAASIDARRWWGERKFPGFLWLSSLARNDDMDNASRECRNNAERRQVGVLGIYVPPSMYVFSSERGKGYIGKVSTETRTVER